MTIEGELIVRLDCSGRRVRRVTVQSTRPRATARVLKGKTANDAAALVPRLFSICGSAQGAAANGALAAAGATGLSSDLERREREVTLEALQDAFRHLLIDWPNAVGAAPDSTSVRAARAEIASSMRAADGTSRICEAAALRDLGLRMSALATEAIFGMPPAAWLDLADVAALEAWCARGKTAPAITLGHVLANDAALCRSATALMPPAQCDALIRVVVPAMRADPAFAQTPTWGGTPVETGALARVRQWPLIAALQEVFGNAVVTRIVARLVELALQTLDLTGTDRRTERAPRIQSMPLGDGEGLAAVETARGLLLHRARVRDERVVDYQIVAPTEWNFHPGGALVRGLEGLETDDERSLLHSAQLAVHALDPCVAFRIAVGHA